MVFGWREQAVRSLSYSSRSVFLATAEKPAFLEGEIELPEKSGGLNGSTQHSAQNPFIENKAKSAG
jgi:hypothetical protein